MKIVRRFSSRKKFLDILESQEWFCKILTWKNHDKPPCNTRLLWFRVQTVRGSLILEPYISKKSRWNRMNLNKPHITWLSMTISYLRRRVWLQVVSFFNLIIRLKFIIPMITKAIVSYSRYAYALRGQFLLINIDKSFILTHAAPTCGEIFRGNFLPFLLSTLKNRAEWVKMKF